jgi:hypothetical protein
MRPLALCVVAVSLVSACSKKEAVAPATPATAEPVAAAAPAGHEPEAFLLYSAVMNRQASDDKKVKNEKTGREEANWMATLYRGEAVTLLGAQGDWSQVRSSDGNTGFIKSAALLASEGVTLVTVLDEVKTFTRPDFLAPSKTVIAPGTLLFLLKKSKDDTFGEVNYRGTSSLWLEAGRLNLDGREVAAARVVSRARALEDGKDEQAKQYWDVARTQFGDTQVVLKAIGAAAEGAPGTTGASGATGAEAPVPATPAQGN